MSPSGAEDADEDRVSSNDQDVASKPGLQNAADGIKAATIISVGQHTPGTFEMEDWEMAPGVIKGNEDGAGAIAFSQSFLVSMQAAEPTKITSDVSFSLKTLKAGEQCRFAAEPGTIIAIAVATGKVHVEIQSVEPFSIGPHGVWKIKAGQGSSVRNLLYEEALLHIMTIRETG